MEYLTVLSPLGELLSPCGKLQFSTGFPCYDLASCVFFSLEDLLGSFCRLPCEVFVNLSWWCWHCVWTSLPTLQLDFVIHENLLWRFVFFVLVLCLFTTFIGRLLYFFSPTLRLDFYCILFYNDLFSDVAIGLPRQSSSWRTRLIDCILQPIFALLPLHCVSRQSTTARSR